MNLNDEYEKNWWGECLNTYHEETKQIYIAKKMGLDVIEDKGVGPYIECSFKSIVDIGGGPVSLLLKTTQLKRGVIIDPTNYPQWVKDRYSAANIKYIQIKAEDMEIDSLGIFDEVWIYNVLQHVDNPKLIIDKVKKIGKIIRIFDWIETGVYLGHPHNLHEHELNEWFCGVGNIDDSWLGKGYYGIFNNSINEGDKMIINFIYSGGEFRYLYYLSIMSCLKVHEGIPCTINLWVVGAAPDNKYYNEIKDKVNICPLIVPEFKSLINKDETFRNTHIKDWYLWWVMERVGGWVIDLDTFFLKPLNNLIELSNFANTVPSIAMGSLSQIKFIVSQEPPIIENNPRPINSAIIWGQKGSKESQELIELCRSILNKDEIVWGDSGPNLLCNYYKNNPDLFYILGHRVLGGFDYEYSFLSNNDVAIPAQSNILHLYHGHNKDIAPQFTELFIKNHNTSFCELIKTMLPNIWDKFIPYESSFDAHSWLQSRGQHYYKLFEYLETHEVKNMLEIGTNNGDNAIGMIDSSLADNSEVHYYGFDLFVNTEGPIGELEMTHGYHNPPSVGEVYKNISKTGAKVHLFKGNTRETLVDNELPVMDLIYYDGGHSIETITSDWLNTQNCIDENTVLFFDDYFEEFGAFGCKFIVELLKKSNFEYEISEEVDEYQAEWGRLRDRLLIAKKKKNANIITSQYDIPHFRFHVIGLPHTKTDKAWCACAYTLKVYNFCKMMMSLGHEVYEYSAEGSNCPCTEHIDVITDSEQQEFFGSVDWRKDFFPIVWDSNLPYWKRMNLRAITEIKKRLRKKDFICVIAGSCQYPIHEEINKLGKSQTVEFGIGYQGIFADFKVFESYSHMHKVYAARDGSGGDGSWYDCVIPNYFDPDDFEYSAEKDDYYLYLGRMIQRKGVHYVSEVVKEIGGKLVLAGQGVKKIEKGEFGTRLITDEFTIEGHHLEYVGYADVELRKKLMSRAKATFVATQYLEPFGGVAVESMLSGTPAICTDFGAFTETVLDGITGFRCRTFQEFIDAANNVDKLNPEFIRFWALNNYGIDRIRWLYQAYFEQLYDIWDKGGWYARHSRGNYGRYAKIYPVPIINDYKD